ncbi:MAG: pyruvate formate lyase family protein, partial [Clostridiales bacterium]
MEKHKFAADSQEAALLKSFRTGFEIWLFKHFENGAIIADYEGLVKDGYPALKQKCLARIEEEKEKDPAALDMLEAMDICLGAVLAYMERYRVLAGQIAAQTTDPDNKKNLLRIEKAYHNLQEGPPQSFFEAVQLIWLTQEFISLESFPTGISLGRMDKYLYPFYALDKEAGIMDYQQAEEIIEALWIKFSAIIHGYQNVTLGGYDANHDYIANDLTAICLEATRKLKLEQPQISLRWNEKMPDWLWQDALATIQTGTGFPSIFNDDICIAAKQRSGVSYEDALDYGVIGCVEIVVPGKEYCRADAVRVNWGKILELMLNGGKQDFDENYCLLNYPQDLSNIASFEEFLAWYEKELLAFSSTAMGYLSLVGSIFAENWPTPFASTLFQGCMENGQDVAGGGTIYNNAPCNLAGIATVVDSLAAIKKAVFEDKIITLR